jgi:hypothetical protein
MMPRRLRLLLPLLPILALAAPLSPALAANHLSGHSPSHAWPALWSSLALLGAAAAVIAGLRGRGRPAAMLGLAVLVALFGFQTAVHSVHHLSDPQREASCAIFAASQHLPGTCAEPSVAAVPLWTAMPSPPAFQEHVHSPEAFGSPEGRAPPPLPLA